MASSKTREEARAIDKASFNPIDRTSSPPQFSIPPPPAGGPGVQQWTTALESQCTFPPSAFLEVMLNLVKNPNLTSTHLFRADIFYDSDKDHLATGADGTEAAQRGALINHLKSEFRPLRIDPGGYGVERTLVRQLVPRNPRLDRPLVQTCYFLRRTESESDGGLEGSEVEEENVLLLIPHVEHESEVPFYHPAVQRLAIHHRWRAGLDREASSSSGQEGSISISYQPFPSSSTTEALSTKLQRTALKLLQTAHKHGQGQVIGYQKKVQHDRILPQKRYQDTYALLKARYGADLASRWVEPTDPSKHVFEDLGIAAFLIELWRDMYRSTPVTLGEGAPNDAVYVDESKEKPAEQEEDEDGRYGSLPKPPFPGFVDIGCGNGVLTYILLREGYRGWGFDARARRTWSIFPDWVQEQLQQRILVPEALEKTAQARSISTSVSDHTNIGTDVVADEEDIPSKHSGVFEKGTFIISNHADELTAWTPLFAYRNTSAFIAIPCCSHDLAGARFRAPMTTRMATERAHGSVDDRNPSPLLRQKRSDNSSIPINQPNDSISKQAAETGSLAPRFKPIPNSVNTNGTANSVNASTSNAKNNTMPSAYASLCSYIASLSHEVGFEVETDVLRIPSTRNHCIVGRSRRGSSSSSNRFPSAGKFPGRGNGGLGLVDEAPSFDAEVDVLRPVSTRHQCIVGRRRWDDEADDTANEEDYDDVDAGDGKTGKSTEERRCNGVESRRALIQDIVERETGRSVEEVGREWTERAARLAKKPGSGH